MTRFACANPRRLLAVQLAGSANGIEFVEVRDHDEPVTALRQRTLFVHLLLPVPPPIAPASIVIDGGERIGTVGVLSVLRADDPGVDAAALLPGESALDRILVVRTAARGDFSLYRLAIVVPGTGEPPAGFDPLLAEVPFSFKVECPSDLDCRVPCTCPPGVHHPPAIDYLAKDYQGFRRLMLERMALLAPEWTERSPADVGVMLVELLAYVADELSYRQDAAATEAYLHTARSRISLRRHARLVDYRVHDGCNARTWVRFLVTEGTPSLSLPAHTPLLTRVPDVPDRVEGGSREAALAYAANPVVFETVEDAVLHGDLAELRFWTWGRLDAALPAGATRATLRGLHPALRPGDVLILAETASPSGGAEQNADPAQRFAVRVVGVRPGTDPAGALFPDGVTDVTEVRWHADDALPRALCLSVDGIEKARAWGNIVLADHGRRIDRVDDLGIVPAPHLTRVAAECDAEPVDVPARFGPALASLPLTRAVAQPAEVLAEVPLNATLSAEIAAGQVGDEVQALFAGLDVVVPDGAPIAGDGGLFGIGLDGVAWPLRETAGGTLQVLAPPGAAGAALAPDPAHALPALTVAEQPGGLIEWSPQPDLLGSAGDERAFVAETEADGTVRLRFGDDEYGARPVAGTHLTAAYRVGNGRAGNIGREAIAHVVTDLEDVLSVTNPLPAAGGVDAETADEIRRDAPATLAVQERAVTASDYEEKSLRTRTVARAAARFRWTGSWHTVFVAADRSGGAPVDAAFERTLRADLERYRMAGYDLEVDGPRLVSLEVALHICVARAHHRADVAAAVGAMLSDGVLADGTLGLFHPDRQTFGQPVYLSAVLAAVHAVAGVESVDVVRFQRQHAPETSGIDDGVLPMGRLEIARLDNDPNFPERGVLALTYGGGS